MAKILQNLWQDESGQDIAEYAVMLAVILVIVIGTVRLIGSNANNVFSNVASSIQYSCQISDVSILGEPILSAPPIRFISRKSRYSSRYSEAHVRELFQANSGT